MGWGSGPGGRGGGILQSSMVMSPEHGLEDARGWARLSVLDRGHGQCKDPEAGRGPEKTRREV